MKKFFPYLYFLLFLKALISCDNKVEKIDKAFYYWKSDNYYLSGKEDSLIINQGIKKLYVKFFEVDYTDEVGNFPISKTELNISPNYQTDKNYEIIPTIYIKNLVFKNSTEKELEQLADNVFFLINKYDAEKFSKLGYKEIQIDCDWTLSTKDKYFYFLKLMKRLSKKEISCTLRLYPYKYPDKMGVPPVDKATLMCYNLINPLDDKSKNSILDLDELKKYLDTSYKYPLHLDIALPVYSWMQVYQNNRFTGIINGGKGFKKYLKSIKPLWYEVTKDTTINSDKYLRIGDKIKYEEIDAKKLDEAISIIKKNVKLDKEITVSLFHLDQEQLSNYTDEEINNFYNNFTK